jgi:hypothetical protein
MSQTNESRLNPQIHRQHIDGRPYHFPALNQEDRILAIFDLPDNSPLPPVCENSLAVYYDYLLATLTLPFDALYCQDGGKMRHLIHYVQVTDLLDPRLGRNHLEHGLFSKALCNQEILELPLAEFGVMEDNPNCQLIDDYTYWLVNCR